MKGDPVDYSSLVDIISNAAGIMVLFACMAMLSTPSTSMRDSSTGKPINYPMAYLSAKKQPLTLMLKNHEFYQLPSRELLEAVQKSNEKGKSVKQLTVTKYGVKAEITMAGFGTGYTLRYKALPTKGISVYKPDKMLKAMNDIVKKYPPDRYFVSINTWKEDFESLRMVRQHFLSKNMEVSWTPTPVLPARAGTKRANSDWDITHGIMNYDKRFSSIKSQ
ncbi:MAG: hypothetical protein HRT89_20775 [Lentisphaeria bacterium]|nr:hypothetical protein [Lentisphaeria bacterium]NQZ70494.1 hypothetical protein [Lentisphaeria bacterium]